jgi:hypothetical protein
MSLAMAVQLFLDAGVDFVVIGGWSALLHGSSFLTADLDICFSRAPDNLKKLAKALRPYHPRLRDLPPDLPFIWDETTLHNGTIFTLSTDLGVIDLLAEVSGMGDFDAVRAGSEQVPALDRTVWTLTLPSLIKAKRAAGREKDLLILPELEALLEAQEAEN